MSLLPPNFTSPETVSKMQAAAASTGGDYKCIVCVFMLGANDSANTVVPYGSNPNRAIYEAVRPSGVRVEQSELSSTILSGTDPQWALHPNLSSLISKWNDGEIAIVRDVGILNAPTTKAQYLSDPLFSPLGLFAHNIQQEAWQAGLPFQVNRTTGWFGRFSNLVDPYFNPFTKAGSGALSTSGLNLQLFAYPPKNGQTYPATRFPLGSAFGGLSESEYEALRKSMSQLEEYNSPFVSAIPVQLNLINRTYRDFVKTNVSIQEALANEGAGWNPSTAVGIQLDNIFNAARALAASTTVPVPDPEDSTNTIQLGLQQTYFISTLENAARLIYSRVALDQRRQVIYTGIGGFDNHNFLRYNHDPIVKTLDIAFKAFWDAIDVMEAETPGVKDGVVIFTESDFGRTLRSNGTKGTDHAWSGHHIVMGAPVNGGMFGAEPDYTLGGPYDVYTTASDSLGRFIPRISTEQYYATLLKWMDIPPDLIELVLPALPLYTPTDIGFLP